jgi:hypothetical protein
VTFGDNEFAELEQQLRAERTEPNESLQRKVADLTLLSPSPRRFRAVRLAATAALTLAVILTAAVLTTSGNAGNGGSSRHDGRSIATNLQFLAGSASASQYEEKVVICHRTHADDKGVTLKLSPTAAKHHLAHHPFDTLGPCP